MQMSWPAKIILTKMMMMMLFCTQVTPESIPQRNASFWKKDILLNKEYEKSFQEKDVRIKIFNHEILTESALQGVTAEDLDLSDTFIASLFDGASKDKEVIDKKEWIDRNYPRSTYSDPNVRYCS